MTFRECPVCGEEYGDGFEELEENESIEGAKVCIVEKFDENGTGNAIIHLPWEVGERSEDSESADEILCRYCNERFNDSHQGLLDRRKHYWTEHERLR
jgi:hypothetical protein